MACTLNLPPTPHPSVFRLIVIYINLTSLTIARYCGPPASNWFAATMITNTAINLAKGHLRPTTPCESKSVLLFMTENLVRRVPYDNMTIL